MMKRSIALCVILLLFSNSFAQKSDFGNWFIFFGNQKIKKNWNFHYEVQYRNYNFIGDMSQLLIRSGFGYNITENNNNILLGYGFIIDQNYVDGEPNKLTSYEHRIFQQFITRHKILRANFQHRYRFEQRFREEGFKMRMRYFLAFNVTLNHKELIKNTVYLSVYNEIFLNLNSNVFDRNRLYGGLGYKFSKNFRLEIGYMNQFLQGPDADQLNIIGFLSF